MFSIRCSFGPDSYRPTYLETVHLFITDNGTAQEPERDMKFHWYWPFARTEEVDWAKSTVRPGEEIVAEVIDRGEAPPGGTHGGLTVRRDCS